VIVAVSRFRCEEQEAEGIAARFRERSRRVDGHDGFLGLEVLRAAGRTPEFLLLTRWESRDALKRYLRSDDFRAVHAEGEEQNADFNLYELVTT